MQKEMPLVALAFLAVTSFPGQCQEQCTSRSRIVLAGDKPSIYLSYERMTTRRVSPLRLAEGAGTGDRESVNVKADADVVLLRLRNNTLWAIGFPTESLYLGPATTAWRLCDGTGVLGLRDGIEVNGRYEGELLEDARTPTANQVAKPPHLGRTDVLSTSWLPPGRSVIVPVLREHLKDGLAIYLPFNYEWETEKRHVRGGEPQHRVYFYSWNLPADRR